MVDDAAEHVDGRLLVAVVAPDGVAFAGPATRVRLPGSEGEIGVLPGHASTLVILRDGTVEIAPPGADAVRLTVSDGFARVARDRVVVLVGGSRPEPRDPARPVP